MVARSTNSSGGSQRRVPCSCVAMRRKLRARSSRGSPPRMPDEPEPMDTKKVLGQLNAALEMQLRSLLQFTQASGSMFGIEVQGVAEKLWTFAEHELEDTRLIVEKITALGGDPTTKIGKLAWDPDPAKTLDHLIET